MDENGINTDDPDKNPKADVIAEIGARYLLDKNRDELAIERPCLGII